ncbi:MAG: PAS domain S-box protein [Verrucomicrobiota bacterium]
MIDPQNNPGLLGTLGRKILSGAALLVTAATIIIVVRVRSVLISATGDTHAANLLATYIVCVMAGFLVVIWGVLAAILIRHVFEPLAKLVSAARTIRAGNSELWVSEYVGREFLEVDQVLRDLKTSILSERAEHRLLTLALQDNEERIQAIFQLLPNGLLIANSEGIIETANEWIHSSLGYGMGELVGLPIDEVLPNRPLIQGSSIVVQPQIRSNSPTDRAQWKPSPIVTVGTDGNLILSRKVGSSFPAEVSARQVPIRGGEQVLEVYSVRDIRQRVEFEMERRKLALAVEQCPSVIYITDRSGIFQYVNKQFTEVTGYTREEAIGKKANLLKSGHVGNDVYQVLWETILRGDVWSGELINRSKDGRLIWVKLIISPIRKPDGEITNFIATLEDITAQRKIATEIATSEKRYKTLFEGAADAIFIYTGDGCVDCNSAALVLFHAESKDVFLGKNLWDYSPAYQPNGTSSTKAGYRFLAEAHASGKARYEWVYLNLRGSPFICEVLLNTMELEGDTVLQAIVRDISERSENEREIQRVNFLAETALELTNAGHWQFQMDGSGCYQSSERVVAILGDLEKANFRYHLADEWLVNIRAVSHEIAEQVWKDFEDAVQERTALYNVVYPYKRPVDGRIIWVHSLGRLQVDQRGKGICMFGVTQDITDSKLAEIELEKARKTAETANEAKSAFLATMSHEIRTPLNAVINMTQLTLDTALTSKQRQYLDVANASAEGLLGLINAILDFSKIEAGKLELDIAVFNLERLLNEVTDMFRGRMLEKQIEFVLQVENDVPIELIGDSLRLRQVLVNLLGNAFKFTENGVVLLHVSRTAFESSGMDDSGRISLQFAVKDTGIGIPVEKQAKLFSAFTQVDSSTSRQFGGTGLGLAISKRFAELMGGEMWLESNQGNGSTFFFTAKFECKSPDTFVHVVPEGIKDLLVLIIDDQESARDVLKAIVEGFGMRCETAASGPEGIAMLELANVRRETEQPFGLVLLDYLMPEMDGLKVAEHIGRIPSLTTVPIIMVSAFAAEQEELLAEVLGVKAFLHKPITASHLFDATVDVYTNGHNGGPRKTRHTLLETPSNHSLSQFHGVRILMAEDNPANQFVAEELLGAAGIRLDIAHNGLEALARLESECDYACVFMDMQMPKMDGLTATREIRKRWPDRKLPIIALTANAMKSDDERCREAGMDDFLSKPINRRELFDKLKSWVDPRFLGTPTNPEQEASKIEGGTMPHKNQEDEDRIPNLPGVDVSDALNRLEIPWAMFRKILIRFGTSQGNTLHDLRMALDEGNIEAATRHAHSIAGSAGNVSAIELRIRAKNLENAIALGSSDIEALYTSVAKELEAVSKSIQERLEQPVEERVPNSSNISDPSVFAARLEELSAALSEGDVVAIRNAVNECRRAGVPAKVQTTFERVIQLSEDYSFPEAAEVLARVRTELAT